MDNRQFLKIDDFLTTDEISTIDNELSQISHSLEEVQTLSENNIISLFSRIYLDNYYENNRDKSDILKIMQSKIFNNTTYNKMGKREPLINLIQFSTDNEAQYTVYEEGGKYLWHIDSEPITRPDFKRLRVANYIYYINDDFEGGELELSYKRDVEYEGEFYNTPPFVELSADKVIIPKKNTLIIMPSDMWHRVKPIIKGKRRTINGHIGFIQ
tara:strand:- start:59 stop:697 length:639 start_codon:yes stop_codon:yes gene_type:complete